MIIITHDYEDTGLPPTPPGERTPEQEAEIGSIGSQISRIGTSYVNYLDTTLGCILQQQDTIRELFRMFGSAHQVHTFGFGRSGSSALSFAIRLRHFCDYLPPVNWIGDNVRSPIRENDLVILFSQSGERKEVELVAENAISGKALIVLITGEMETPLDKWASLIIRLPKLKGQVVYGGGDFELAAFFFQELLVTLIGSQKQIPAGVVGQNHV